MKLTDLLRLYPEIPVKINKLMSDFLIMTEALTKSDGCLRAANLTDPPTEGRIGNPTYQAVESLLENIEEIGLTLNESAQSIKSEINDLIRVKQAIDTAMTRMTYEERRILELRYFEKRGWGEVCKMVHLVKSNVWHRDQRLREEIIHCLNARSATKLLEK